jgi:hypothetical protein
MLHAAGFSGAVTRRWRVALDFDAWVTRIRTPPERIAAIRSLWQRAPDEVREYFDVRPDGSFQLDVLMLDAVRRD